MAGATPAETIANWLKIPSTTISASSCLVVVGPVSCGKSTLIDRICEEADLQIYSINSHNCANAKAMLDHVEKATNYNLLNALECRVSQKAIIIDDIDILVSADRCISSTLYEFITKRRVRSSAKIICICSVDKRLGDIKRNCQTVALPPAAAADIMAFLRNLGSGGGGGQRDTLESQEIAKQAAGSFATARRLYESDANGGAGAGAGGAAWEQQDGKCEPYEQLFRAPSRDVARNIVEEDIRAIPLRFHENLPKALSYRQYDKKKQGYIDILWNIIEWDVMMADSDNAAIATEHFLRGPCSILPAIPYTNNRIAAKSDDLQEFTKLLSRLSLQKKSLRTLHNTGLPWQDAPYILQRKGPFFSS